MMFLSSNKVGHSVGYIVSWQVKGKKHPGKIPGPGVQADYGKNFNGVNRNGQDSANYSTTICTNCYYIRIFCWAFHSFIHAVYVIVYNLSKAGMGPKWWKVYDNKNFGHRDFQMDLAIDLINYGIGLDWDGKSKARPSFMPKHSLIPCKCYTCFFCKNGLTKGITHQATKKAQVTVEYACETRVRTDISVLLSVSILESHQGLIAGCVTENSLQLS